MGVERLVQGEIVVDRAVGEVYGFYADFENLPRFLGDVAAVHETGPDRWRWTVSGPFRIRVPLTVQIDERVDQQLLSYRTVGPVPARWTLRFTPLPSDRTRVVEELRGAFGPPVSLALAMLGKHPLGEVHSNLQRLKEVLEEGRARTTTHAVRGKFPVTQ